MRKFELIFWIETADNDGGELAAVLLECLEGKLDIRHGAARRARDPAGARWSGRLWAKWASRIPP